MTEPEEEEAPVIAVEPDHTPELFIDAGGAWLLDAAALCAELDAVGFANGEGCVVAYVRGKGEISLATLIKEKRRGKGAVTAIRGGKP